MDKINVAVSFNMVEPYKGELIKLCEDRCNLHFVKSTGEVAPLIDGLEAILGVAPTDAATFGKA